MTKSMQWLLAFTTFIAFWSVLLARFAESSYYSHVFLLPIYVCITFAVYAASVVLYRVFSFNNCEGAAKELKEQIIEAREDLKRRGFSFD